MYVYTHIFTCVYYVGRSNELDAYSFLVKSNFVLDIFTFLVRSVLTV